MYAVIGSGKTKICTTQAELNLFKAVYPYSRSHYVETYEEGLAWIRRNQRTQFDTRATNFGSASLHGGYIDIEYFIDGVNIYYNLWLRKFGRTRVLPDEDNGVLVDNRKDLIKVKILNTSLNNAVIAHHGIAIRRILKVLGEFADVNIQVPDMSVYIALTSYRGKDMTLKRIQEFLQTRLGGVSFTVKEYK